MFISYSIATKIWVCRVKKQVANVKPKALTRKKKSHTRNLKKILKQWNYLKIAHAKIGFTKTTPPPPIFACAIFRCVVEHRHYPPKIAHAKMGVSGVGLVEPIFACAISRYVVEHH